MYIYNMIFILKVNMELGYGSVRAHAHCTRGSEFRPSALIHGYMINSIFLAPKSL